MSNYYKVKALNMSALSKIEKSPLHCKHYIEHGGEDTKQMKFGRHGHAYLLEREKFNFKVVSGNMRLKENQDLKKKYEDEGYEVLSEKDYNDIVGAVESVLSNSKIANWLKKAECEKPIYFEMEGIVCKGLLDTLITDEETMLDFKFVEDANPQAFRYKALKIYKYHRQMAWYRNAAKLGLGIDIKHVYLIAVEKKAPYAYSIIKLSDDLLEEGKRLYEELFELYKQTVHVGNVYGYENTTWHSENYKEEFVTTLDLSAAPTTPLLSLGSLSNLKMANTTPQLQNDSTPMIVEDKSQSKYPKVLETKTKYCGRRKGVMTQTAQKQFEVTFYEYLNHEYQLVSTFYAETKREANALLKKYL